MPHWGKVNESKKASDECNGDMQTGKAWEICANVERIKILECVVNEKGGKREIGLNQQRKVLENLGWENRRSNVITILILSDQIK